MTANSSLWLLHLHVLLILHLLHISRRCSSHKTSCSLHSCIHSHKCVDSSCRIASCRFHASGKGTLYITFPHTRVLKHRSLITHMDQLL